MLKYSTDLICTPFELKEFAFSSHNFSAFNFARFVECKSAFKYTLIEIEFLVDAFKILEQHLISSKNFKERWQNLDIPTIKLL